MCTNGKKCALRTGYLPFGRLAQKERDLDNLYEEFKTLTRQSKRSTISVLLNSSASFNAGGHTNNFNFLTFVEICLFSTEE